MEYAILRFNDELKVDIPGLGLVSVITLYPELWKLYLKKMELQADYLSEVIKGIKEEESETEKVDRELAKIRLEINKKTLLLGLQSMISVVKIGNEGSDVIVRDLRTKNIYYVSEITFRNSVRRDFKVIENRKEGR